MKTEVGAAGGCSFRLIPLHHADTGLPHHGHGTMVEKKALSAQRAGVAVRGEAAGSGTKRTTLYDDVVVTFLKRFYY